MDYKKIMIELIECIRLLKKKHLLEINIRLVKILIEIIVHNSIWLKPMLYRRGILLIKKTLLLWEFVDRILVNKEESGKL
jgi:hypothetical protein